jgi:phosphoribosylformimino-5-aminoimidazole carboxamide ribotide isomerase
MIIYPAMDLMGGRCVRLAQGRFEDVTAYPADPAEALAGFARAGASWAHIVDLDGARAGMPVQHDLIASLARAACDSLSAKPAPARSPTRPPTEYPEMGGRVGERAGTALSNQTIHLQVGGGFRDLDQAARMFDNNVARVVIGSLAVKDPAKVREFFRAFGPERIALALDVNIVEGVPMAATHGWAENSQRTLWEIVALYPDLRHILITDISRDGMLTGPNLPLLRQAVERLPAIEIQASGGVSCLDDLAELPTKGAIVGKALWEGRIDLAQAIEYARA